MNILRRSKIMKKVKLINDNFLDEIIEKRTKINEKVVWSIDTSVLRREKVIIFNDENNRKIREIIIPKDMLVFVEYID